MNNKILRIILKQNKAHYRKEESVTNKMTYPLPPYSTIIGAIHNACGYRTYHPMDVSVQGKFESLSIEFHNDSIFYDSIQDDRGILVKLKNKNILNTGGYIEIARTLKSNEKSSVKGKISFKDETRIKIINKNEFHEYKLAKKENNKFIKKKYAELEKIPRRYEVLYGVNLVIHIDSDEDTLNDIYNNINNLTAIGRSEDFVDIIDVRYVEVFDDRNNIKKLEDNKKLSYYVATKALEEKVLRYKIAANSVNSTYTRGTTYYLNKDYNINDKKRIFNKKRVSYISSYGIDTLKLEDSNLNYTRNESEDMYRIYLDEEGYLVNLM